MLRIVTDSTCDLNPVQIQELNLDIIPLNVIIEGHTYSDGIELTTEQFYEKMATAKTLPSTSQPSPALFQKQFQQVLDGGDDVYYVGLSSSLSGTIQSARIGRELTSHPERITIFDSLTATYAQGQLVLEAHKLAAAGKTPEEITARLTELRSRQHIIFTVDSLDNLRKGGRINNLAFLFGSLLNIKPILRLDSEGVVQVYEKVRGRKNANLSVLKFIQQHPPDPDYPIAIGHTVQPENAKTLETYLEENGMTNFTAFEISGVIGTHAGYGAMGFIFFSKE